MKIQRPFLFVLTLIFLTSGLGVIASATSQLMAEQEGTHHIEQTMTQGLTLIGGPGCFTVCTDGCPGICRTCCDVNGTLLCTSSPNGCTPE